MVGNVIIIIHMFLTGDIQNQIHPPIQKNQD